MSERNISHGDFDPHDRSKGGRNADTHDTGTSISKALDGVTGAGAKADKTPAETAGEKAAAKKESKSIQDRLAGR
jgi:hypothetical protein